MKSIILILLILPSSLSAQNTDDKAVRVVARGLSSEVLVRRDERSIPYIEASNDSDLYFAQGYITASDRLWQMDLLRRTARGELSEIFGSSTLEEDKRRRTLGFGRVAAEMFKQVSAEMRRSLESYAAGVNFYISTLDKDLPVEFRLLQYRPAPWKPEDSLLLGKLLAEVLSTTWPTDLTRLKLSIIPSDKRSLLLPKTSPLDLILVGRDSNISSHTVPLTPDLFGIAESMKREVSNNWVVSGKHTVTGLPLLANDPHLPPSAPSLWYMTHLKTEKMRVAGVTIPGSPGILLGHNDQISWGATNLGPDVQDLYLEKFDPANPTRYQTSTGWREALVVNEPIKVRKSLTSTETTTVDHKVVITSNRPIVFTEGEKRFSLRWTALDPATNEFEAFLKINRARDWRSFVSALRSYPGPSMNFVYADKRGNIGYYAAGRIPVRKTGDGSIPYDGASDAGDWASFIPFEKLPTLFNPPSGIIVTANNRVVGTDYPFHLTHEWVPPYRARRIHDLLTVGRKFTVEDFLKIQADTFSYPDHIFAREIERIAVDKSAAEWKEMHDLVKGWDGKANSQSTILPLVVETRRIFTSHLLEPFGKFNWLSQGLLIDEAIKKRPPALLPKGFSSFEELVMTSYREAKKSLEGKLGPDQSRWSWERYSVPVQFPHPLARIPILGSQFVIDPIPAGTGGSNATVNAGANVSMRMVVDLRDMDNTRQGLGTGQSGNPASPHWKDQLKEWSEARPRQFPFSKEAVEAKTKLHTILVRQ